MHWPVIGDCSALTVDKRIIVFAADIEVNQHAVALVNK
jgi:hypothetical protein